MAAYLIVDTLLDDADLYEEYKLKARPLIEKFGGEYLARGGRMTLRETDLWSRAVPCRQGTHSPGDIPAGNIAQPGFAFRRCGSPRSSPRC